MNLNPAPDDDRTLARSHRRDAHVRSVSRVTRTIAAFAILGTAIFGGLAAAHTNATSATTTGTAASASTGATASSGASSSTQAATKNSALAAPAAAPSSSTQPPVASSGGS